MPANGEESARTVPMQVICLGMCRTGTQSIADALENLGYGQIYHMRDVVRRGEYQMWVDAIDAHRRQDMTQLPGVADFDRVLGNFKGVTDIPAAVFIPELLDAYPDAKLLLTVRPPDEWARSMRSSVLHAWSSEMVTRLPAMKAMSGAVTKLWDNDFDANGIDFYNRHNQRVRDEAAKRGRPLLEFDLSEDGSWARMCAFLGKQPPEGMTAFPHSDLWISYRKRHGLGGYTKVDDTDNPPPFGSSPVFEANTKQSS